MPKTCGQRSAYAQDSRDGIYLPSSASANVVDKFGIEFAVGAYGRYQRSLGDIAEASGIVLDQSLIDADQFAAGNA